MASTVKYNMLSTFHHPYSESRLGVPIGREEENPNVKEYLALAVPHACLHPHPYAVWIRSPVLFRVLSVDQGCFPKWRPTPLRCQRNFIFLATCSFFFLNQSPGIQWVWVLTILKPGSFSTNSWRDSSMRNSSRPGGPLYGQCSAPPCQQVQFIQRERFPMPQLRSMPFFQSKS